jgi:hypothetical protein
MAANVFISYRRDDSAGHAGRIHDRLRRHLGRKLLFMDVDSIPLGVDFSKVLRNEVEKCEVLLALIGPQWLDARDDQGERRLEDPNDFLRFEIATALERDIRVIPVLLDGAGLPDADQLPENLRTLALRNGLAVRHASFHDDMERLIGQLKGAPILPRYPILLHAAAELGLALVTGAFGMVASAAIVIAAAVFYATLGLAAFKEAAYMVVSPLLMLVLAVFIIRRRQSVLYMNPVISYGVSAGFWTLPCMWYYGWCFTNHRTPGGGVFLLCFVFLIQTLVATAILRVRRRRGDVTKGAPPSREGAAGLGRSGVIPSG